MKFQFAFLASLSLAVAVQAQTPTTPPPAPATYNTQTTAKSAEALAAEAADKSQNEYVQQFKDAAINEMERAGIPASITLAQAILESNYGQSELAQQANNHFGIKCAGTWTGKTYKKKDDEKDENGQLKESCFRKYSKVDESFFDHSEFLRDPRKYYRYGFLFGLDKSDYRGWARGLESAGYATESGYADKLINLIEKFQLYQYDNPETQVVNSKPSSTGGDGTTFEGRIGRVNDVKVVLSRAGETLDDVARVFRINPEKMADYNERQYTPGQPLRTGTRLFIQSKKSKWRGRATHHFVREGQSMFDISQQYGVKLKDLRKRNGIEEGQEPATGERIRIRGRRKSDELVRLRDTPIPAPGTTSPPNAGTTPPKPNTTKPGKPATSDEELPEITGDSKSNTPASTPSTPKPSTTTPGTTPTPSTQAPANKPSTTGKPATAPPANTIPGTNTPPASNPGNIGYPPSDPVPVNEPTPGYKPPVQPSTPATNQPGYHTVVKGDTLFSLSRKYSISVAKLKSLNGMTADDIKIGQKLRVQ